MHQCKCFTLPKLSYCFKISDLKISNENTFLIYDQKVVKINKNMQKWVNSFNCKYMVKAGENLKNVENFPYHIKKIVDKTLKLPPKNLSIISIGGGSVGDFSGFVASILRRGVRLIHIPSTWLAAIDSSHGGKTALNVAYTKNVLGTFYPAEKNILIYELLQGQSLQLQQDAFSEMAKIVLLTNKKLWFEMLGSPLRSRDFLWKYLPKAISGKYQVVKKDPLEKNGWRQILNLGHTLGHVVESYYKVSHGQAVGLGLIFAINWSYKRKYLSSSQYHIINEGLKKRYFISKEDLLKLEPIPFKNFKNLLLQDKKRNHQDKINFIFLKDIGVPLIKKIRVIDIIKEAEKQNWIRIL